jgi:uridine monophosphate synthetase
MNALGAVIAAVPRAIPVILDAKRGDIAETSAMYARAAFETLGAGAITLSPYIGRDGLAPFIENEERGAFILCKTSNAGADELQALETDTGALFEVVARHAQDWNTRGNVGLVVGATDTARLARVRALAPELWFLVPGIGAQGGDLKRAVQAGLRADGLGLLVNASRSIAVAADPGEAARRMRDEMNGYRSTLEGGGGVGEGEEQLAEDLLAAGAVRFGEFILKSGQVSPIYLDLRRLVSYPAILRRAGDAYARILRELEYDRIAGIPYAALPLATAAALTLEKPLIYPRREAKGYGTQATIEGEFRAGETVVVLDDLATTGETKFEAIEKLTGAGLKVRDIVVLIDREQGAGRVLAEAGLTLHAVTTLPRLLEIWRTRGRITEPQYALVMAFLS